MTTTPTKHVIQQGPHDFDALLHGQYIGSFPSELQAWTELNRVLFVQLHEHDGPPADCAAGDIPTGAQATHDHPDITPPMPPADLQAAATRLHPDPALTKAL